MYGTREVFSYFQCASCGCLQISEIPDDLGRFYPNDYYSYQPRAVSPRQTMIAYVKRCAVFAGGKFPSLRKIVSRFGASMELLLRYRGLAPTKNEAILDVGCGAGDLLRHLADLGYRNAMGVDPFVPGDQVYRGRVLVRQADIFDLHDTYDVISFHHSLEHLPDQRAVLQQAARLLKPGGTLIVRIPIVGGNAWEKYHEDWVGLDPPRHLYLHSRKSISLLASQVGLITAEVDDDTDALHYWGSELRRRDIPLLDPRSPASTKHSPLFTAAERAGFEREARLANAAGRGDQITALLRHPNILSGAMA
jgi:SAM-dependent methyltransferase